MELVLYIKLIINGFKYYIAWKIFNSGMNRNMDKYKDGTLENAYGIWNLTEEQLEKSIKVLSKYFTITKPESEMECLCIKDK